MWTIAPLTREFSNATVGETIPALGKGEDEPYGCCAYKNSRPATQNFKLFGWEDIAGANLLIDTGWSPRESATAR